MESGQKWTVDTVEAQKDDGNSRQFKQMYVSLMEFDGMSHGCTERLEKLMQDHTDAQKFRGVDGSPYERTES